MAQHSKQEAAKAAIDYLRSQLESDTVLGIGTGSTVNCFIDELAALKPYFDGAVASSKASALRLEKQGISVYDLNSVNEIPFYIDGADESDHHLRLIKGGGGALTREKIVAAVAKQFLCIADESKYVRVLGGFPLPIEVIPMARSFVARELVKLGGTPTYRVGVVTDNGNQILDVQHLPMENPAELEIRLNNITGVVCHGLFASRGADKLFLAKGSGVVTLSVDGLAL